MGDPGAPGTTTVTIDGGTVSIQELADLVAAQQQTIAAQQQAIAALQAQVQALDMQLSAIEKSSAGGGVDGFTVLMLHCDGNDNSTTFTNSSQYARAVMANGNAKISKAQSKFGGASCSFDGASSLSFATAPELTLGAKDFTVDFWFQLQNVTNLGQYFVSTGDFRFGLDYGDPMANMTAFLVGDSTVWFNPSYGTQGATGLYTNGMWYHFAVVRNGCNYVKFINGVPDGAFAGPSQTIGGSIRCSALGDPVSWAIGTGIGPAIQNNYLNGYIDELRVSVGVARWLTGFVPPTAAYD
jgi:hypothetical protein